MASILLPKPTACKIGNKYLYAPSKIFNPSNPLDKWPDSLDPWDEYFGTYDIDFALSDFYNYVQVKGDSVDLSINPVSTFYLTRDAIVGAIAYLRMSVNVLTWPIGGTQMVDLGMQYGGNTNFLYCGLQYRNFSPNARLSIVPVVNGTVQTPVVSTSAYSDLGLGNTIIIEIKIIVNSLYSTSSANLTINISAQGIGVARALSYTGNFFINSGNNRPTWYNYIVDEDYFNTLPRLYEFYWSANNTNLPESCQGDPPYSEVKMQDIEGNSAIYFPLPERGYRSNIVRPFDIVEQDDGKSEVFDAGNKYDKRICEADFVLDADEALDLSNLLSSDNEGRARLISIALPQDSDFHMFAPDTDPKGTYTVSIELLRSIAISERPYKMFRTSLRFISAATLSPYSLPAEVDEGALAIGTVQSLRFPADWFDVDAKYAYYSAIEEGGDIQYVDRGINADRYKARTTLTCNTSKAGALVSYLQNVRAGTFQIRTSSDMYMFGREKGSASLYTVRFTDGEIHVVHEQYNRFKIDFGAEYIA